jgi:DNA ligase-1
MNDMNDLRLLQEMVAKLQHTSSSLEKQAILGDYPELQRILAYTYNSFKQYYVTSASVKKWMDGPSGFDWYPNQDLYMLLDALSSRALTGNKALDAVSVLLRDESYAPYQQLILNIIDRDLKCKTATSLINKVYPGLIPTFDVALAANYWDHQNKVDFDTDIFYASRKLDGARTLLIIDEAGDVSSMSRTGKEFVTLQVIKDEIKRLFPSLRSTVLDGEMCIVDADGTEHFDQIVSAITRKNYTIPNAVYNVFDMLTLDEFQSGTSKRTFSKRLTHMRLMFAAARPSQRIVVLPQVEVQNHRQFLDLFEEAMHNGWEGLILRRDAEYKGKRSTDLLKVKSFSDAEYTVTRIITGPFQMTVNGKEIVEDVVVSVKIRHKGNEVGVGSGFSLAQRRHYYKHPEELLGKTIKVKYFAESVDTSTGLPSLRFPTVSHIYDNGRQD